MPRNDLLDTQLIKNCLILCNLIVQYHIYNKRYWPSAKPRVHSTPRSILVLFSYLHLSIPSCLFNYILLTRSLYAFLFLNASVTCPTLPTALDFIRLIINVYLLFSNHNYRPKHVVVKVLNK